jgi:hypothetical protein
VLKILIFLSNVLFFEKAVLSLAAIKKQSIMYEGLLFAKCYKSLRGGGKNPEILSADSSAAFRPGVAIALRTSISCAANRAHSPLSNWAAVFYRGINSIFHTIFFYLWNSRALLAGIALGRNVFHDIRPWGITFFARQTVKLRARRNKATPVIANPATRVANFQTRGANPATRLVNFATCGANPATRLANFATRVANPATRLANFATRVANPATRLANFQTRVANPYKLFSAAPLHRAEPAGQKQLSAASTLFAQPGGAKSHFINCNI